MLNKAFKNNPNIDNLIFHSDQGWQYQHSFYTKRLEEKNIIQSMSRKGNSLEMANGKLFGIMKSEMFMDKKKYRERRIKYNRRK